MALLISQLGGVTPVIYTYAASGGIVFGGTASLSKTKALVASGGVVFGGVGVVTKSKNYTAAGGVVLVVFGGVGVVTKSKNYVAAGGVIFGGAATTSYVAAPSIVYTYIASGGIVFGGAAVVEFVRGLVILGGTPGSHRGERWHYMPGPPVHYDYEGTGGIIFGGAAVTRFKRATVVQKPRKVDVSEIVAIVETSDEVIRKWNVENDEDEAVLLALMEL